MKKVFITGIAGFLGSHLADKFLSLGYDVHGCDNLIGGYVDNVPQGAVFHEIDCNNLDSLCSVIPKNVDILYHTACNAYEGLSVFSPSVVCQNTFQISINAMTAAIKRGVGRFIHCSSMARYGALETLPFTEDMICQPVDPYGISKFASENVLRNLSEIHRVPLVIAVPHNIIGPRQKYDDPFRNVAAIMINLMLQGRAPIIYGDGQQVRCFSDISDVVSILNEFAENELAVGEIFNVGPDEHPMTVLELSRMIADLLGIEVDPIFYPDRPQEAKFAVCSSDKIRKYFSYKTETSIQNSLSNMIEYIRDRGVRPFQYHLNVEILNDLTPKTWSQKIF